MTDAPLSLFARVWLAISCALRVIFDGALARRVVRALETENGEATAESPDDADASRGAATNDERRNEEEVSAKSSTNADAGRDSHSHADALGLLSLFQREGRLVDFLKQEIDGFGDAEIGSATRVVHAGCRKALLGNFEIARIRDEAEGASVTVPAGYDGQSLKLTGNVRGSAPYCGVLRHGGWRVRSVRLPERVAGYDATIITPAEVEL